MSYTVQENLLTSSGWAGLGDTPIDQSMATNFVTASIDVLYFDMGCLQAIWTGTDSTTGVLTLEFSTNDIDYCTESGSALTISEAACNQLYNITSYGPRYARLRWVAGDATTGTMNFRSILKARR